jgi:hypothetical protein
MLLVYTTLKEKSKIGLDLREGRLFCALTGGCVNHKPCRQAVFELAEHLADAPFKTVPYDGRAELLRNGDA